MNTKVAQDKFFIAKIVVAGVIIVALLFLGFLGIMKLLEKNVLAQFTTKDLAAVIAVSTSEDAQQDFMELEKEYPMMKDTVLGILGSDTQTIWGALRSAEVKQIYVIVYTQGTVIGVAPTSGEKSNALKDVLGKVAKVQEKDGIWMVATSPEMTFASLAPTKEFQSIASSPVDTSVSNSAMITYRTYAGWNMASALSEAINTMPVSSVSLVLHSAAKVFKDSSGSFLRLADGGYMLITDSHTTSDLSTYFPQKTPFDMSLLAHLPSDTKEFLGAFFDPAALETVKDFLHKEVSTESSTIFTNYLHTWIQDTLKTVAPESFLAELPRTSVLVVRNKADQIGGVFANTDSQKTQAFYDQLYSAARFHYALEEVPVTLPDRTKGTYLRLNEGLLQKKTTTASGITMDTIEKEGQVLITKSMDSKFVSIASGTGSLLAAEQGNALQNVPASYLSPNLSGVAMKTIQDPIEVLMSAINGTEKPQTQEKKLYMGYKIFRDRVHLEFILK